MAWEGSDRRSRLPANWDTVVRPRILRRDRGICWKCGKPGADAVDHKNPGDDHSDANLAAIHQDVPPYCHRIKSSQEGNAEQQRRRRLTKRPTQPHPGLRRSTC